MIRKAIARQAVEESFSSLIGDGASSASNARRGAMTMKKDVSCAKTLIELEDELIEGVMLEMLNTLVCIAQNCTRFTLFPSTSFLTQAK
jgi:hypothetical protein